jgi:hypothetical protein
MSGIVVRLGEKIHKFYLSFEMQPDCTASSLETSSSYMPFCSFWPSALLSHVGTQRSLIL